MKYFAIFLILAGFVILSLSSNTVFGLWIPETPDVLLEQSETVFVGTITSVNVLEFERSNTYNVEENGVSRIVIENYTQSLDQYTVNIEEFLKNPQESNTITLLEATVGGVPGMSVSIGGFELGDRVLFYVPKLDGTNQYSPESFKIPKYCNARDVLAQKKLQMIEDFTVKQAGIKVEYRNFTANKPIEFVFSKDMETLEGKSFDAAVVIAKNVGNNLEQVLNQEIHAESKPCEWIASATWELTPEKGDYEMSLLIKQDNGSEYSYTGFSVIPDISHKANVNQIFDTDTEPGTIEEKLQIAKKPMIQESDKIGSSGPPILDVSTSLVTPMIIGAMISTGSFLALTIYWRKRK